MNLLIVEDSIDVRRRILRILCNLDVKVIVDVGGVAEALNALEHFEPDILILDIKLPDGTGFDILEKISFNQSGPLAIVLSNYTTRSFKVKSFELGASIYLDKSNEFDLLPSILADYIGGKSLPLRPV